VGVDLNEEQELWGQELWLTEIKEDAVIDNSKYESSEILTANNSLLTIQNEQQEVRANLEGCIVSQNTTCESHEGSTRDNSFLKMHEGLSDFENGVISDSNEITLPRLDRPFPLADPNIPYSEDSPNPSISTEKYDTSLVDDDSLDDQDIVSYSSPLGTLNFEISSQFAAENVDYILHNQDLIEHEARGDESMDVLLRDLSPITSVSDEVHRCVADIVRNVCDRDEAVKGDEVDGCVADMIRNACGKESYLHEFLMAGSKIIVKEGDSNGEKEVEKEGAIIKNVSDKETCLHNLWRMVEDIVNIEEAKEGNDNGDKGVEKEGGREGGDEQLYPAVVSICSISETCSNDIKLGQTIENDKGDDLNVHFLSPADRSDGTRILIQNVEACSNDTVVKTYQLSDNQIMDSYQINTEIVPRIERANNPEPLVYSSLVDEMKKSKRMEINSTLGTVALFDPILKEPDDIGSTQESCRSTELGDVLLEPTATLCCCFTCCGRPPSPLPSSPMPPSPSSYCLCFPSLFSCETFSSTQNPSLQPIEEGQHVQK
jgi:hypothetical protein